MPQIKLASVNYFQVRVKIVHAASREKTISKAQTTNALITIGRTVLLLLGPRSWSGQHRGRWAGRAGENVGRQNNVPLFPVSCAVRRAGNTSVNGERFTRRYVSMDCNATWQTSKRHQASHWAGKAR